MESQEVVPIEAGAADRWNMVEAAMRAVPVVVVKPGEKMVVALLGVLIRRRGKRGNGNSDRCR